MLAPRDSRILLLAVSFALLPRIAAGQAAGETVIVREPVAENLYVAGGTVRVDRAHVLGDLKVGAATPGSSRRSWGWARWRSRRCAPGGPV